MGTLCDSVALRTRSAAIMGLAPPPTRREELAEFLRHLRERTAPESVGIETDPTISRRRTPGLRREEVSQLAGVGLSWYTWLEQGREITPSPSVLDALARVFALNGVECGHLFDLAGVPRPGDAEPYPTQAPPELAAFVQSFEPFPSFLLNPRADVLAFNPAAERVISIPGPGPDGARNLLRHLLTAPGPFVESRAQTTRMTVARFRAAHARRYDDPRFRELIEALLRESPRFRELWPRHEVLDSQSGSKTVEHAEMGTLRLLHLQSIPTSEPELRLAQYLPADEATREALVAASERAAVAGSQAQAAPQAQAA
jgi:transcriptional regulator with XRE-family HTH domain